MPIKFVKAYSVYRVGDVAAFAKEDADRLVSQGYATHFEPQARASHLEKSIKKSR